MGLTPELMDEMFRYYEDELYATYGQRPNLVGAVVDGTPERHHLTGCYPPLLSIQTRGWTTPEPAA